MMFVVYNKLLNQYNFGHCFSRFHDWITIFGRAYVDFVLNFYIAMLASPCAKNDVLRMLEAHFWKKRMWSLDEKIHHSYILI